MATSLRCRFSRQARALWLTCCIVTSLASSGSIFSRSHDEIVSKTFDFYVNLSSEGVYFQCWQVSASTHPRASRSKASLILLYADPSLTRKFCATLLERHADPSVVHFLVNDWPMDFCVCSYFALLLIC